jgi:hypothetical protein
MPARGRDSIDAGEGKHGTTLQKTSSTEAMGILDSLLE